MIDEEEFIAHIKTVVNPARKEAGLPEIRALDALACFRILDDFYKQLDRKTDG